VTPLAFVVSRISVGKLYPAMTLSVADSAGVQNVDGKIVPINEQVLVINIDVVDAENQDLDESTFTLTQHDPLPDGVEGEEQIVAWVYSRIEAVLLHEVAEFFRFDGQRFKSPAHPLP
jgi:hypothetical protein